MIKKNWKMRLEKLNSPQRCEEHQSAPLPDPVKTTASFTKDTPQESQLTSKAYFSLKTLWRANSFTHYHKGE